MFVEERLDLGITYGTTATITTNTAIVETFSGAETRSINWVYPLLKFNIGQKGCLNQQLEYFLAFHAARKGAYEGFRFKDWADYQFNTLITLNANKQGQLFKQYSVAGSSVKRPLLKIVNGSVSVFVNDVAVTQGWSLNYNTGVITFVTLPTGTIRVVGEFDVPVRFDSDKINLRFKAYEPGTARKLFDWEGLTLTEVKILPAIPLEFDLVPQTLNHLIDLGYDYDSIGGNEFATRIERLVSGHETRISEWANNRGSWEVGQKTLLKSQLDYLIALFRVCRGRAISFKYFNWQSESEVVVRFGEDAIAFRFDAFEKGTERVLFNLAGVPLVNTEPVFPNNLPLGEPFQVYYTGTSFITGQPLNIEGAFTTWGPYTAFREVPFNFNTNVYQVDYTRRTGVGEYSIVTENATIPIAQFPVLVPTSGEPEDHTTSPGTVVTRGSLRITRIVRLAIN